jgi:FkbM family methyltransferase
MATALNELVREGKRAIKSILPQPLLNWREVQYFEKYGEIELHILEFLCDPARDAIDIGANDGCYVHFLKRYSRRVYAFEPQPILTERLRRKFPHDVVVKQIALSRAPGTAELRMPLVDGLLVTGCSTISHHAAATYPAHQAISVPTDALDNIYSGDVGIIKIDVEGYEDAVLDGARKTIARCNPTVIVEVMEHLSPGGYQRVSEYFRTLGYRGYFIWGREFLPLEAFDCAAMQRNEDKPSLAARLETHDRFPSYVYNFIFLPQGEPAATLDRIRTRLLQL